MRGGEFRGLAGVACGGMAGGAHAQQPMAVIGFLRSSSRDQSLQLVTAFHRGLNEGGYVEGQNVAIEYRWAEGQNDRMPTLAGELVRRKVAVIVAAGNE